jgi:hypothetical protein
MYPDPSINRQKQMKKNLDFNCFVTSCICNNASKYVPVPSDLCIMQEKLNTTGNLHRGRIVFDLPVERIPEILHLRTVNNFWVIIGHTHQAILHAQPCP